MPFGCGLRHDPVYALAPAEARGLAGTIHAAAEARLQFTGLEGFEERMFALCAAADRATRSRRPAEGPARPAASLSGR